MVKLSIEFESPANRIISQFAPKNKFAIDTSLSGLALLRRLSIQGRLVFVQGARAGTAGVIVQFTPPNGTTFFFLKATILMGGAASLNTFDINNDGMLREQLLVPFETIITAQMPMDSLVGNGTKSFEINQTTSNAGGTEASLFGWTENTSRIRDVSP